MDELPELDGLGKVAGEPVKRGQRPELAAQQCVNLSWILRDVEQRRNAQDQANRG